MDNCSSAVPTPSRSGSRSPRRPCPLTMSPYLRGSWPSRPEILSGGLRTSTEYSRCSSYDLIGQARFGRFDGAYAPSQVTAYFQGDKAGGRMREFFWNVLRRAHPLSGPNIRLQRGLRKACEQGLRLSSARHLPCPLPGCPLPRPRAPSPRSGAPCRWQGAQCSDGVSAG